MREAWGVGGAGRYRRGQLRRRDESGKRGRVGGMGVMQREVLRTASEMGNWTENIRGERKPMSDISSGG